MKIFSPKSYYEYLRKKYINAKVFNDDGEMNPEYEKIRDEYYSNPYFKKQEVEKFYKINPHLKEL